MDLNNTKKQKIDIDRLSALPEAILVSILSLLDLQTAVVTSVLSRQWRNLWKQLPSIKLNKNYGNDFFAVCNNILFKLISPELNLVNLIIPISEELPNHVFFRRCSYYLDTWIPLIYNRLIKNLSITIDITPHQTSMLAINLPSSLFICQSLITLKIGGGFRYPSRKKKDIVRLPNLKTLCMDIHLRDEQQHEFVENTLKGCPILEDLKIKEYGFVSGTNHNDQPGYLFITARKLKKLHLVLRSPQLYDKVTIDAPNLEFILLDDTTFARYTFVDTPKGLSIAYLKIIWPCNNIGYYDTNLLGSISRIKILCLSYDNLETLVNFPSNEYMPVLNNLEDLKVAWLSSTCCDKLMRFLQNFCPNLLKLELHSTLNKVGNLLDAFNYQPAACLVTKVKVITIANLGPSRDELELVRYLLRNARVLELLHLVVGGRSVTNDANQVLKAVQFCKELEFCEELFQGSNDKFGCRILFSGRQLNVSSKDGVIRNLACGNLCSGRRVHKVSSSFNFLQTGF